MSISSSRFTTQLAPLNRRLLFWGDIGDANPDAVSALPKDMIAVPWNYWSTSGFDKMIEPFAKNGIETWVAPGDANWNEVYPVAKTALWNIQGFIRDGQRLGSTGALTTVWNDDGEGLFNMDWYGVLFGAVAAWQPGESSIADYQDAYGAIFHLDPTGKINEAEKELMAAQEALGAAKTAMKSDRAFLARSLERARGRRFRESSCRRRTICAFTPSAPSCCWPRRAPPIPNSPSPSALTAMDLGARRLDLIGLKFQLAQEIASAYAQAAAQQHDKAQRTATRQHARRDQQARMAAARICATPTRP